MRVLFPIVPMLILAACTGTATASQSAGPSPVVSTATAESSSIATPSPTPSEPAASPSPPATAQPAAAVASVTTRTFALFALGDHGASGTITATRMSGSLRLVVRVSGLQAMTAHAVHLHAGNCGFAYGGRHILTLGTIVAGAAGTGSLQATASVPISGGRFVIVYAGLSQGTILGCGDLGSI